MSLKNKKILITAGPTWVALDDVRVISNTASGQTGVMLAELLRKAGARVTLCLGPGAAAVKDKSVRVLSFRFFDELKKILASELIKKDYDAVIHSAAVSDFQPARCAKGKLVSSRGLTVKLAPTPKLIGMIKKLHPDAVLIGFKYEPHASPTVIIKEGRQLMLKSDCDLVVANTRDKDGYRAFLVSRQGLVPEIRSKKELTGLLKMYLQAIPDGKTAASCSCGCCGKK